MTLANSVLKFIARHPLLDRGFNRTLINHFATTTKSRPRAFSLWSAVADPSDPTVPGFITDYSSWPSLTNKRYSGRHLRPAAPAYTSSLPPDKAYTGAPGETPGDVTGLFARKGAMTPSRSSLLFMFFAQWFTDSILRINPVDRRMNTSNHDIDLCQIYGLTEETARLLRSNEQGKLRSQRIHGEEYPDYLCESDGAGGWRCKTQYLDLPANQVGLDNVLAGFSPDRREKLYATGLERGNSSIGYTAISTVFLREHNRICGVLVRENPSWDDERLFQTARVINIVLLLKLVVEDYINHIMGHKIFRLDHQFAEEQHWYRANWIAIEFDLLYRWHGLVPDGITIAGDLVKPAAFRSNNALLEQLGVGPLIECASKQHAGEIGLGNSPDFLWAAESMSIKMSRTFRLRPYNEYRELFSLPKKRDFADLTKNPALARELERLYGDIDRVEFVVGLFGEDAEDGGLFGDLLSRMVAYDAFTQIFSNPLLSQNVYGPGTFTDYGCELISQTSSVQDLVNRNVTTPVQASLGAPMEP
jgi:prostaglandin-endoperoxide synthase 2